MSTTDSFSLNGANSGTFGILLTHNNIGANTWTAGITCDVLNGYNQGEWTCSSISNTVTLFDGTGFMCCRFLNINISLFPGNPFSRMTTTGGPISAATDKPITESWSWQWFENPF